MALKTWTVGRVTHSTVPNSAGKPPAPKTPPKVPSQNVGNTK
jgi:hypothetical protein